jgi:hypothetical protein
MIYVKKVGLDLVGKTCQEQYILVDQAIFLVNPKSYYQKMKQALFRLAFISFIQQIIAHTYQQCTCIHNSWYTEGEQFDF